MEITWQKGYYSLHIVISIIVLSYYGGILCNRQSTEIFQHAVCSEHTLCISKSHSDPQFSLRDQSLMEPVLMRQGRFWPNISPTSFCDFLSYIAFSEKTIYLSVQ